MNKKKMKENKRRSVTYEMKSNRIEEIAEWNKVGVKLVHSLWWYRHIISANRFSNDSLLSLCSSGFHSVLSTDSATLSPHFYCPHNLFFELRVNLHPQTAAAAAEAEAIATAAQTAQTKNEKQNQIIT